MARYFVILFAFVSFSLERMCYCNVPMTSTLNDENKIFRSSCRRDALFKITDRNKKLLGQANSLIGSSRVKSLPMCVKLCIEASGCRSVNYKSESTSSTERNCQLLDVAKSNSTAQLKDAAGWKHYEPISQVILKNRIHVSLLLRSTDYGAMSFIGVSGIRVPYT